MSRKTRSGVHEKYSAFLTELREQIKINPHVKTSVVSKKHGVSRLIVTALKRLEIISEQKHYGLRWQRDEDTGFLVWLVRKEIAKMVEESRGDKNLFSGKRRPHIKGTANPLDTRSSINAPERPIVIQDLDEIPFTHEPQPRTIVLDKQSNLPLGEGNLHKKSPKRSKIAWQMKLGKYKFVIYKSK
jgi:hypothetical protein